MKKTTNGLKIKFDLDQAFYVGDIFSVIDRIDKSLLTQQENARKTREANPNFLQNRKKYEESKQRSEEIVAENVAKINANFGDNFIAELIKSFNAIGIDETLKNYEDELTQLLKSSNLVQQNLTKNQRKMALSDSFFLKLATKYPDFILYLPARCFIYSVSDCLHLEKLTDEQRAILEKKLTEADVFQNEMFRKLHLKYFPNHIANMTYEQAIYAINFRPSCFALLKPDSNLRASFKQNPNILVTIIKNSPLVIKYLTRDEIYSIPDEKISVIGYAISKEPQILEYLPTDFFKKHNPKYVFQTIKHKLKSSILSYYQQQIDSGRTDIQPMDAINRFPELATYFSSSQMVANPKKSVKKSKEIVVQKNDEFEDEFDF